ncbi:hypothetical protein M3Y94_01250500 [Aphelenchoides besseyi]|nr:hypothetical protein M3Y94_01250500 [Aphelenchoides besseyi]
MIITNNFAFGRLNSNDPRLYNCVCNEHANAFCYICYYNGDVNRLKSDYKRCKYVLSFLYLFLVLSIVGINVVVFASAPGSTTTEILLPVICSTLVFLIVLFLFTIICTIIIIFAFIYVTSHGILIFTPVALIIFIVLFIMGLLMTFFQGCGLYGALRNYRNGRTALKQVIQRSSNPPIYSVT